MPLLKNLQRVQARDRGPYQAPRQTMDVGVEANRRQRRSVQNNLRPRAKSRAGSNDGFAWSECLREMAGVILHGIESHGGARASARFY